MKHPFKSKTHRDNVIMAVLAAIEVNFGFLAAVLSPFWYGLAKFSFVALYAGLMAYRRQTTTEGVSFDVRKD